MIVYSSVLSSTEEEVSVVCKLSKLSTGVSFRNHLAKVTSEMLQENAASLLTDTFTEEGPVKIVGTASTCRPHNVFYAY